MKEEKNMAMEETAKPGMTRTSVYERHGPRRSKPESGSYSSWLRIL